MIQRQFSTGAKNMGFGARSGFESWACLLQVFDFGQVPFSEHIFSSLLEITLNLRSEWNVCKIPQFWHIDKNK